MNSNLTATLVSYVFKLIYSTFDVLLAPFVAVITALFPDISTYTSSILSFISTYIVPYIKIAVSFMYNAVGLSPATVLLVVTYLMFLFNGKALSIGISFVYNVYHKLKP